jgi:addiction module HigA family antidote
VHPGEILREDLLKELGLSIHQLARDLHMSPTRISEIVNERRAVTAVTAFRLARHLEALRSVDESPGDLRSGSRDDAIGNSHGARN